MRRPKGKGLNDRQARALVDKENSLGYAIDFPGNGFHGRNIFKNTQIRGDDERIDITASNARSAKQFRRYGICLLQHAAYGRKPGSRITYDMNKHDDRPRPALLPLNYWLRRAWLRFRCCSWVRKCSSWVQMLCAMSSFSSNLIVASGVSIVIVPRRGVVEIVDMKTSVILCASSIEQFLASL
jgi:hypothetical protein